MKIAVPTRDERVDDHFGHCDHYTIFTIEDNKVVQRDVMASPQGCGCKSGIAADLQELGVVMMLAGNMGEGAKSKLNAHNIDVIRVPTVPVAINLNIHSQDFIFCSNNLILVSSLENLLLTSVCLLLQSSICTKIFLHSAMTSFLIAVISSWVSAIC